MERDALDNGYKMIKKSHIEQTQEIKELNETLDEVNKCYKELSTTHEEFYERNRILQLHSIELDEAKKKLEAQLEEINSIYKNDESPNDIKSCEMTCVPKSEHEKLMIELEKLKRKKNEFPNALKEAKYCAQCKNKATCERDANIFIKLKDENEKLRLEVKSVQSGYGALLTNQAKYHEMLSYQAIHFEKEVLGYPPFKDTCKPPPSIKI